MIQEGFKLPEDGLYSGFDEATQDLRQVHLELRGGGTGRRQPRRRASSARRTSPTTLTLEHPRCVYQLLKKHYSRYTPEMVERITGIPKDQFLKAADLFTSIRKDGDTKKVAHHHLRRRLDAAQLRHADHPHRRDAAIAARQRRPRRRRRQRAARTLQYSRRHRYGRHLRQPAGLSESSHSGRQGFRRLDEAHHAQRRPSRSEWDSFNYWSNTPKFAVSFLKAMYGDAANKENDWAFDYLPKVDREYSWTHIWDDMYQGKVKGLIAFGMNGVAIGPNSQKNIDALKKAELAGGLRYLSRRNQRLLEIPRHHAGGDEEHPDRGLSPARRGIRRKRRHLRQLRALAAMEVGRRADSRRLPSSIRKFWRAFS